MSFRQVGLALLVLSTLIACNAATPTPIPAPLSPVAIIPSATPTWTAVPTPELTATPQLVLTWLTPTPLPTRPPLPTATATVTGTFGTPVVQSATKPELGSGAADRALVSILQKCWQANDPRQLNGNNPAHREAFECARTPLSGLAAQYPTYALVHRILAWGYYFKDNNIQKAQVEYRTSANLYHQAGDKVGESEARLRLGLLLVATSKAQACVEFSSAGRLDSTNDRAVQYYSAYACGGQTSGGQAAPPPVQQVNLDQVRGKILFKTDREGVESVYVMDPDGSNQKRVQYNVYLAASKWEAWSPDHTQVAVVRLEGYTRKFGYNNDIWVTDPSGGSGRPLANPANDYDPVWSPRGLFDGLTWLAFVSNRGGQAHSENQGEELWIMHSDSTNPMRLTCHGPDASKHPSWSPDAKQLVFYSSYPGGRSKQIYVLDMTRVGAVADSCNVGDTIKNLSNSTSNDYDPVWVK